MNIECMSDVFDDAVDLLGLLREFSYMAVDKSGKLWAYSEIPKLEGDTWNSGYDALFIRDYHKEVTDWDRLIFNVTGLIPIEEFEAASDEAKLFEEIKHHLKIARGKHPEFPENKGFGFAAIAEEGFELVESIGRQLSKLARAINDNECKEACIDEAKDTIVTLIRLIETMRSKEESKITNT